jgi:penicillin-binding protein 1A
MVSPPFGAFCVREPLPRVGVKSIMGNMTTPDPSPPPAESRRRGLPARLSAILGRGARALWGFVRYDHLKDWLPRHWGWRLVLTTAALSLVAGMLAALFLYWLSLDLPTPSELTRMEQARVTHLYDAEGNVLKDFYVQQRDYVPLDRIPRYMREALLSVEDQDFYEHWGINLRRIASAIYGNVRNLSIVSGASTLTQQLARNYFDKRIGSRKTVVRKLREQLTAVALERNYSKDEILEMYLNEMYFANGAYGIQQAARNYFGKSVEELDITESAFLAGILQLPYYYFRNPDAALRRRNLILQHYMVEFGALDRATADTLAASPLQFEVQEEEQQIAPFYVEHIRRELSRQYGDDLLLREGASISSTLNSQMQEIAERHLHQMLRDKQAEYDRWVIQPVLDEILAATPEGVEPDTSAVEALRRRYALQGAFVALDPVNGNVLALIGGRDFEENEWNNAIQATRQAGSAIKPFLYTAALDNGYTPATRVMNQPITIPQPDGTRWTPTNYYEEWGEPITLREALRRSINLVSARIITGGGLGQHGDMSPEVMVRYMRQFGITTPVRPYPSIAVGAADVTLLEMVAAYSTFANLGVRVEPRFVRSVRDRFGRELESTPVKRTPVLEPALAYLVVDLMKGTLEAGGTAQLARTYYTIDFPAAGKTGTTNDFTNAWFIGYTPRLVAGVWIGFAEQNLSMQIPGGQIRTGIPNPSGAVMAMPVWARFMRDVYKEMEYPTDDWRMPPGIVQVELCRTSPTTLDNDYKLALPTCPDRFTEIFLERYVPTETCTVHDPRNRRDWRIPPR